jgi:hypothetical protein
MGRRDFACGSAGARALARADGFEHYREMYEFFRRTYKQRTVVLDVLCW